ncbi:MAG: hypothetical protein KJO42_09720 [Silicimonas sp.]|nr:hypothetical protein [Silicimonas sp.]
MTTPRPRLVSRLLFAAGRLRDISLTKKEKLEPTHPTERLGQASQDRPEGHLLWVHSETPDEAAAAPAIAKELHRTRGEAFHVLVTTVQNGALPLPVANDLILQLAPGETPGSVSRFLDHWKPDAGIFLGIPDRPNLILAAHERKVPLLLAASSRGSLASRRRLSLLSSDLLDCFDLCLAASAADAEVLYRHLDDKLRVEVSGPLSDTTFALPCSDAERDATANALKGRPVWLAAEISMSEVDAIDIAHRRAFRFAHRLLLVVVPTNPADGSRLADMFGEKGWKVGLSSVDGDPSDADQVFIADYEESRGLWYRLAPTTYVGGTLTAGAATSDPYAPATLGSAVIHGPNTGQSTNRFKRLSSAGASVEVVDGESLGDAVQLLLSPDKAAELAQAGWKVTTEAAHVVERLADLISTALDERETA